MNISKLEQRVLHALAQGGCIRHDRGTGRRIDSVLCITRDGTILSDCTLPLFQRLRRRGLIASENGAPYRIATVGTLKIRISDEKKTISDVVTASPP